MKCPECSRNHKYSFGMTCGCGYRFVLDPKRDSFTDGKLLAAVRKASANETLYFTFPQLATTVAGMRPSKKPAIIIGTVMLLLAAIFPFTLGLMSLPWTIGLGLTGSVCLLSGLMGPGKLDIPHLRRMLEKYEAKKGAVSFLLRDDQPLANPPSDWAEQDLYDYGVEGILIVSRPILVDLFVMNGLHAANRVLVVSECGYPNYIVRNVNRILSEQPGVSVYALHDVSADGASMAARLRNSEIFHLIDHSITDLGIHKSDLERTPKLRQFESRGKVSVDHLRWSRLSSGVGTAIVGGVALVDVIGHDPEASSSSFGFG